MILLALAAGWLFSTRPGHKVEGDFYHREQDRVADEFLLGQCAGHPVAALRARACLSLARVGGPVALERLVQALEDPAPSVRAMAAFGIGVIEDAKYLTDREPSEEAALALLATLGDPERYVVALAVEALGKMRYRPSAIGLTQTPAPLVYTLTALVRLDARRLIPWMAQRLKSADQDVRWAAAIALLEIEAPCDEGIRRSFVNLVRDRNDFVRAASSRGLGTCDPNDDVFNAIGKMLGDRDPKVRYRAVRSLARLGDPSRAGMLSALTTEANPNVREAVVEALEGWRQKAKPKRRPPRDPTPASTANHPLATPIEPQELQRIARTEGRRLVFETSLGNFDMALDYDNAPLTSERFYRAALKGEFDFQPFARVRPDGYVQAAAREDLQPASQRPELSPEPFLRGSVGMVRSGADLDAPEFFIALTTLPFADGRYTNFGRLLSGDDLLDKITDDVRILRIRPQ